MARDAQALTVTATNADNGLPALAVSWKDSFGFPRKAIMVKASTNGSYVGPGYLRQYTYQVNGSNRVCTGTSFIQNGTDEFSGDGFVQNHSAFGFPKLNYNSDFSDANNASYDPNTPGTTTVTLQGSSHALITFSMPSYFIGNTTVPTTIQWLFADGRNDPLFSICQDARALATNGQKGDLAADSRSPYGDMAYDGYAVNSHVVGGSSYQAYVGGCSYGDNFKFVTLASNPEQVTIKSGWKATTPNTIPYAMQWAQSDGAHPVDAEMGHVATVPGSVNDQGSDSGNYPAFDPRGQSKPNGPMPNDNDWAFQILNYQWPGHIVGGVYTYITNNPPPLTSKRLTWGRNFGSVGGFDQYANYPIQVPYYGSYTNYNQHWSCPVGTALGGKPTNGLLMAYSVFVVFGTHSGSYTNGAVSKVVSQMENNAKASLSATVGSVVTSGAAGIAAASNTITYSPAGYIPSSAGWKLTASNNSVNAILTPATGYPLDHPLMIVGNYTSSQLPTNLVVGPGLTNPNVDYYATVDTNSQMLWVTVNRLVTITNPVNLMVNISTKQNQTINFPPVPTKTYGVDYLFDLATPVASSGLPVTVSVLSGPATITPLNATNNLVSVTGAGIVTFGATNAGNASYNPAGATAMMLVNKGSESLTFPQPSAQTYSPGGTFNAIAISSGDQTQGTISYASSNTNVVTINSAGTATIHGAGTTTLTASEAASANYNAAAPVSRTVVVSKPN